MKLPDDGNLQEKLGWWLTLEELESWLKEAELPELMATQSWEAFPKEPVDWNESCLCPVSLCIKETKSMEEQKAFSTTVGIRLRADFTEGGSGVWPVPYHLMEFTQRYDLRCDDQWADGGKEVRPYQVVPAETARLLALSAIESMKEKTEESNEDYAASL